MCRITATRGPDLRLSAVPREALEPDGREGRAPSPTAPSGRSA